MRKNKIMTVEIELWTPERAKAVLAAQEDDGGVIQRKRRDGMVGRYVRDMREGAWVLTHQAVALAPNGGLIDGQHRLSAIAESGLAQEMLTVRYLIAGAAMSALAATDIGGKRTVAEVLTMSGAMDRDGARDAVAVVTALRALLDPSSRPNATPHEVRATFAEHRDHIEWAMGAIPRKGYAAPVRAAFAFARGIFPEQTEEFAKVVMSGAAPAGSPAQTWNQHAAKGGFAVLGGGATRVQVMLRVLRLIRAHVTNEGHIKKMFTSPRESLDWFKAKARKSRPTLALAAE